MTMRPTIFGIQFHPACIVSVALVILAGGLITLQQTFATNDGELWPSFTMTYETPGSPVSIGERTLRPRETISLRWEGPGDWRAEVTRAESFNTGSAVGTVSTVGSWRSYDGTTFTRYNSITNHTHTSVTPGDALPAGMLHPVMSRAVRGRYVEQGTEPDSSTFNLDRGGSVDAVVFDHGGGDRSVFTTKGIPLELPDGFRVLKLDTD